MTLLVQEYLRSGKTLEQLKEEHGVKSNETNGKVCLNYDQIEARESDTLACQCRGLVLRKDTWDVVAVPFFRFFNYGQEQAANIDWNTAAFEEKLDGSCIIVYYDKGISAIELVAAGLSKEGSRAPGWKCGTRGRCEADADAHGSNKTFAELVNITVQKIVSRNYMYCMSPTLNDMMSEQDRDCTYIFELTTPINRVVCKYEKFGLTLLGVRNNITLEEKDPRTIKFEGFDVGVPKLYEFKSLDDMIEVIREWNPEFHEGVVVKDKNYNRIKVKNPSYVAWNHMRDSLATSFRGCMEVILLKKDDDVIHMMDDTIANRILKLKPAVSQLFKTISDDYNRLKDIDDMKAFAFEAQKCIWPGPLFAMKRGKIKDLDAFIFSKTTGSHVSTSMVDTILDLCKKVDPSLESLL